MPSERLLLSLGFQPSLQSDAPSRPHISTATRLRSVCPASAVTPSSNSCNISIRIYITFYVLILLCIQPDFKALCIMYALIPCSSYTFEAKAQPISFVGSSPARVGFDIKNDVEIWIEVRCTKLMQLWVSKVFEPVSPHRVSREKIQCRWYSQQDSATLSPDALCSPQVFSCEIPHGVTDV